MSFLKGVHHLAVICSNYKVSKKFYTEILGFNIENEVYREERDSYKLDLSLNGVYVVELFSFPNVPKRARRSEAAGLRQLAFKVTDSQNAVNQLPEKGMACEPTRTDEFTGKKFTFLFDPDELPVELYKE